MLVSKPVFHRLKGVLAKYEKHVYKCLNLFLIGLSSPSGGWTSSRLSDSHPTATSSTSMSTPRLARWLHGSTSSQGSSSILTSHSRQCLCTPLVMIFQIIYLLVKTIQYSPKSKVFLQLQFIKFTMTLKIFGIVPECRKNVSDWQPCSKVPVIFLLRNCSKNF